MRAQFAGVLRRHVAREQEELPVGGLIAVMADASVAEAEIDAFIERFRAKFAARSAEAEAAAGAANGGGGWPEDPLPGERRRKRGPACHPGARLWR